jgi:hypothetical protein
MPVEMKAELQAMGHEPGPVLKAIRRKCLDCSGGSAAEVADCLVKNCALYPFRMGKNAWRVEMSPEQRAIRGTALNKPRAVKNPRNNRGSIATDGVAATQVAP